jgi:uncharacterized cupin superfamily protein
MAAVSGERRNRLESVKAITGDPFMTTPPPFINNMADLPWETYPAPKGFGGDDKLLTAALTPGRLDCALTRIPPGHKSCPYHFHHIGEELFIIMEGEGTLRYDGGTYRVRAQDVITCKPGPGSAHQFINDTDQPLVYLAISTEPDHDICEYPDSNKVMSVAQHGETRTRHMFQGPSVDYWHGEV